MGRLQGVNVMVIFSAASPNELSAISGLRREGAPPRHCERSEAIQLLHFPPPGSWIASALRASQ
jgi:hypothetical protein